jgi:nitrogen regulatory protein PII
MKKIEIIIPHERIDNAIRILNEFGIRDEMSFYQINGSREKTQFTSVPVGRTNIMYTPKYGGRTKIEALVEDALVKKLVEELLNKLTTGSVSDGKIFVYDAYEVYDIGSGKKTELNI